MISKSIILLIRKILKISQQEKINLMFIGGIAVSVWGNPRATYDIDIVAQIEIEKIEDFLKIFYKNNFGYNKKEPLKSIQNLQFITFTYPRKKSKIFIDFFIVRGNYFQEALKRKQIIKIFDLKIPVISPEDLILYKLLSRRERDMEDIRDILTLQKGKIDIDYLKKWAEKLGVKTFLEDELKTIYFKRNEK